MEAAAMHPRVQWYLDKLRIQNTCEKLPIKVAGCVVNMQRRWRQYYYRKLASGTLKSQQTPTNEDVPKMLLNLTQQMVGAYRYIRPLFSAT